MGEVISITSNCDPEMLKKMGHFSYFFAHKLYEQEVLSEQDFVKTLYFRRKYFREKKWVDENCSLEDFTSNYDRNNKIINLKWHHEIVASVSLHFPNDPDYIECLEGNISAKAFKYIMNKKEVVEASKLYVDARFNDTDVYQRIFEILHREVVLSERSILIMVCPKELVSNLKQFGLKEAGKPHFNIKHGLEPLTVLVSNQKKFGAYGLTVGPWKWNLYYSHTASNYPVYFSKNIFHKIIISFYALTNPVCINLSYLLQMIKWMKGQLILKRPLKVLHRNLQN